MSDSMTTFLIIMSETAIFFAAIIFVFLIIRIRSSISLKCSAKQFVKKIKNNDPEHSKKLKDILLKDYDMDESSAAGAVENLVKQEHLLYSKIIELYLGTKDVSLDDIDADVKNLTKVMHGVTITSTSNTEKISALDAEKFKEEIKKLQEDITKITNEKEKVEKELKDSLDTMEGMMTEYASMYAGGVKEGDIKMREEIEKVKERKADFKDKVNPNEDSNTESSDNSTDEKVDSDLNIDVPDLDIDIDGLNNP